MFHRNILEDPWAKDNFPGQWLGKNCSQLLTLLTGPPPVPVSQTATGLAPEGFSLAKCVIPDFPVGLGFAKKAEAFLSMNEV